MEKNNTADPEIACRQILRKDFSIFSAQWTVIPSREGGALTPALLLERYLNHLRRATGFLVRPQQGAGRIEFRLLATRLSLLSFEGPFFAAAAERQTATLKLAGGALVVPESCHRGELTFSCEPVAEGVRAGLELSDYCPLLLGKRPGRFRRWLYRLTQAAIHRLVTVRFLVRLQRELAGRRICCRVVRIRLPGEPDI